MSDRPTPDAQHLSFDFEHEIFPAELEYLAYAQHGAEDPEDETIFIPYPDERQSEKLNEIKEDKRRNLAGLALSGGGIRSAAICTGAMQALASKGILQKFDYLSTVSGGGYAGTSLSWFLNPANKNLDDKPFGVEPENFPFQESEAGNFQSQGLSKLPSEANLGFLQRGRVLRSEFGTLIDFIRHRAAYLQIAKRVSVLASLAMVLRTAITSLLVYLTFFTFLYYYAAHLVLEPLGKLFSAFALPSSGIVSSLACADLPNLLPGEWTGPPWEVSESCHFNAVKSEWLMSANGAAGIAMVALLILVLVSVGFSWSTYFRASFIKRKYGERKASERRLARWVTFLIFGVVMAFVLIIMFRASDGVGTTEVSGLGGIVPLLVGTVGALGSRLLTIRDNEMVQAYGTRILIAISAFFRFFGLVVTAIWAATWADHWLRWAGPHEWAVIGAATLVAIALGHFANINYFGLHGLYSNRLMETFMPGAKTALIIESTGSSPRRFTNVKEYNDPRAAETMLHGHRIPENGKPKRPFHIINANVVLASSRNEKHKGRGGDSFMLTSLASGSKATGWTTADLDISLPSAMAISGAAVNPRALPDAKAAEQDRLLAILMTLLNLRLGYWIRNPRYYALWDITRSKAFLWAQLIWRRLYGLYSRVPNYVTPGLSHGLSSSPYTEKSAWLELTDGGHFDNIGLNELVRRKTRFIVAIDGSTDPDVDFTSFANSFEKIRSDFGVNITFDDPKWDFNGLLAGSSKAGTPNAKRFKTAARGFAVGRITYPDDTGIEPGWFFLIKSVLCDGLRPNLYSYRAANKQFPDQPTLDQFFDEQQFECYRMLGEDIANAMISEVQKRYRSHPTTRPAPFF